MSQFPQGILWWKILSLNIIWNQAKIIVIMKNDIFIFISFYYKIYVNTFYWYFYKYVSFIFELFSYVISTLTSVLYLVNVVFYKITILLADWYLIIFHFWGFGKFLEKRCLMFWFFKIWFFFIVLFLTT